MTTGLSLQKDLIQANAVVDSTVAATEVVAETVDEAETEVAEAETVEEAETEVAVAETVEEAAATEVVADSDNVAKAAVAAPVDIKDYTK